MNKRERDRLVALERRRDELERRLAGWEHGNPSRTQAEFSALTWAIKLINESGYKTPKLVLAISSNLPSVNFAPFEELDIPEGTDEVRFAIDQGYDGPEIVHACYVEGEIIGPEKSAS